MDDIKLDIDKLKSHTNIAELLTRDELHCIAAEVVRGYEIDEESRSRWTDTVNEAMEIAMQIMEEKSFPWEGAANIKYPLITQASIDYASRTIPEILQNDKIVKCSVVGIDPDNTLYERSDRVSTFMSYDLMTRSPDWVEGTDKLLQILPVLGTVFKKTYYNELERRNCSDLCVPDKIVVNYGAQSLDSARRITHLLTFYKNDVISRQRKGIFLEEDSDGKEIDPLCLPATTDPELIQDDQDRPLTFLEQHCYLDLDGDGYREPYIVTVHKETQQVFRIKARFKKVEKNARGKIIQIIPKQSFTDFHFIRSPDGGFYSMGFGSLLLPTNKAINSILNMLIDSGTLANLQGGFITKNVRLKNGEIKFKMGKYQVLECAGEDISKNILTIPTKEPSQTLLSLLGMLMQVGKDLSSTTDVLSGQQPAQNVASSTVAQLVEQGTKVFVAINKRLYRSLKKEYEKLYGLNSEHLSNDIYRNVLNDSSADVKKDFDEENLDICPAADPTLSSEAQRIYRAGMIQQLRTIDPREADKLFLQAMQVDKNLIEKLLPDNSNQPPSPQMLEAQAKIEKMQAEIGVMSAKATLDMQKLQMDQQMMIQNMKESEARIANYQALVFQAQQNALHNLRKDGITEQKMQAEEILKAQKIALEAQQNEHDRQMDVIKTAHEVEKNRLDTAQKARDAEDKRNESNSGGDSGTNS